MESLSELARIDRYTCKFENPVMEDNFMAEKWKRVRKPLNFAVIFFSIVSLSDAFSIYKAMGGFSYTLLAFPLFILGFLSFFLLNEEIKKKKFDLIFCILFLSYQYPYL